MNYSEVFVAGLASLLTGMCFNDDGRLREVLCQKIGLHKLKNLLTTEKPKGAASATCSLTKQ